MIRINLMPEGEGKKKRRRASGPGFSIDAVKVVPIGVLALTLTSCLGALMLQSAKEKSLEKEVAIARSETEKYKRTIALIDEMVSKENELNRRLDIVKTLDQNRFRTVTVLDEMAKRVPNYLWLTSVKESGGNRLAIDGMAFSNLVVSDLMTNLDDSKVFESVELSVAKRKEIEGQNVINFTLTTGVNAMSSPVAAKNTTTDPANVQADVAVPAAQIPAAAPANVQEAPAASAPASEPSETVGG